MVLAQLLIPKFSNAGLHLGRGSNGAPECQEGVGVGVKEILLHIDCEIAQLKRARALLNDGTHISGNGNGRPHKNGRRKKLNLSPEGRKRIAEAQKRRWERARKAAGR
jgi:hypothetical protein